MKGVTSDLAARAIIASRRNKFPPKKQTDVELSPEVVKQLEGRAGMSYGFFKGNIYNGSREWTVTRVTIILKTKVNPKSTPSGAISSEYNVDLTVPPLSNQEFIFSANSNDTSDYDWGISRARGYKSH